MKRSIIFLLLLVSLPVVAAVKTKNDGDWSSQLETLRDTPEAAVMIRVGDIDNLGFGFPEDFDPFCQRSTEAHFFPWKPRAGDAQGTDRILVPSSFGKVETLCGTDGYSYSTDEQSKAMPIVIPLETLENVEIDSAVLQLFVDDFQSPALCSKFRMSLNGRRFAEGELLLNSLNQTGPIGKVVSFPLPTGMLDVLKAKELSILIDDPTTGAGDGFAIDFAKLLVNHRAWPCHGVARGMVVAREDGQPVKGATVELRGYGQTTTDGDGRFEIEDLPTGMHPITAYATGYNAGSALADVWQGGEEEILIELDRSDRSAAFGEQKLREGDSIAIRNIQFDVASAELRADAKKELDKIFAFLTANPEARIELSGHTSSEGEADANKTLSLSRVESCKTYLAKKGIDEGRILTVGYGEERPIAENETEAGRATNRRVEMRLLKL